MDCIVVREHLILRIKSVIICLTAWSHPLYSCCIYNSQTHKHTTVYLACACAPRHKSDSINVLRVALHRELLALDAIPEDLKGIPLVSRRDSALRPLSKILSEDCWIICNCISNKSPIPRTLLKNGKREKALVTSQPRSTMQECTVHSALSPISSGSRLSSQQPTPAVSARLPDTPSHANISNRLIAKELSTIREDITNLKSTSNTYEAIPLLLCLTEIPT